ncbi:MAG: hypothetical protein FD174_1418 [Geobacteraceae bacterium]|nr:MAG: hypothetical protein FD174_1418 [Geobacteraceae bacterium]
MYKRVVTPPLNWELGPLPVTAKEGEYLLQTCTEDGWIGFDTCHFYDNSIDSGGPLNEGDIVAFVYLGLVHNVSRRTGGA